LPPCSAERCFLPDGLVLRGGRLLGECARVLQPDRWPSWLDRRSSWSTFSIPSQYGVFGVACPLVTLCYASDDGKTLISSTPASEHSWSLASIGINGIAGLPCPTPSKCIGVDGHGDLIVGTFAPSPARTRARLEALISQLGNATHIRTRLRRHTRFAFTAPSPGDLSIACYLLPARHRGRGQPRRLLGTATALFKSAAHRLVTIRLTRAGRQLTRAAQLRLAVTASFTPAGQRSIRLPVAIRCEHRKAESAALRWERVPASVQPRSGSVQAPW
jgi:hypothetical protein